MSSLWFEHSSGHQRKDFAFMRHWKTKCSSTVCGVEPSDFMPLFSLMRHIFCARYLQEPDLRKEAKSCSSLEGSLLELVDYYCGSFISQDIWVVCKQRPPMQTFSPFSCYMNFKPVAWVELGMIWLCASFIDPPKPQMTVLSLFSQQWQRCKWPMWHKWDTQ